MTLYSHSPLHHPASPAPNEGTTHLNTRSKLLNYNSMGIGGGRMDGSGLGLGGFGMDGRLGGSMRGPELGGRLVLLVARAAWAV